MSNVENYLVSGSPFLPPFEQNLLTGIISDMDTDSTYYPGEAVAKYVSTFGLRHARKLSELFRDVKSRFNLEIRTATDINLYASGFYRPMSLLFNSYYSVTSGKDAVTKKLLEIMATSSNPADEQFSLTNLQDGEKWLLQNMRTGEILVKEIVQREMLVSNNLFYQIGLGASKATFNLYIQKVLNHYGSSIIAHGH